MATMKYPKAMLCHITLLNQNLKKFLSLIFKALSYISVASYLKGPHCAPVWRLRSLATFSLHFRNTQQHFSLHQRVGEEGAAPIPGGGITAPGGLCCLKQTPAPAGNSDTSTQLSLPFLII